MNKYLFQRFKNHLNKYQILISMTEIKIFIKIFFRSITATNYKLLRRYKKENNIYKLNLGCGDTYLKGWLNTDIFPKSRRIFFLDATKEFPFENKIFDYVFSEHMIEHISYNNGKEMIRECFRVLKNNGRIRISTPNINFLIELVNVPSQINKRYLDFFFELNKDYGINKDVVYVVNDFMRSHGHLFIYSPEILKSMLKDAGFIDIKFHSINKSDIKVFRNLENDKRMPEGLLALETFTIEGKKPG